MEVNVNESIYYTRGILDDDVVNPKTLLELGENTDLTKVLSIGDKLMYYTPSGIDLELSLHHFDNNIPKFDIKNIYDIFNNLRTKTDLVDIIGDLAETIKDDKYFAKILRYDNIIKEFVCNRKCIEINDGVPLDQSVYDKEHKMIRGKGIKLNPKLSDNTWKDIIWASKNNRVPCTWKIGDEIAIQLSGLFNEPITLQIWDFNHFDKTDGTGRAGILFGTKDLTSYKLYMDFDNISNAGGWDNCSMKNVVMKDIYNSIPVFIRDHIEEVYTYANTGGGSWIPSTGSVSKDKVFIPGLSEIYNDQEKQNDTEIYQFLIPIFKDTNNKIKKLDDGTDSKYSWWTRSPFYESDNFFCYVDDEGEFCCSRPNHNLGISFCFNI